jgi:phosphate transport system substrate-binding protein
MIRQTLLVAAAFSLLACGGDSARNGDTAAAARSSGSVDLTGAGATFPYPIYSKWFSDYAAQKGVRINYASIGSGGGVRQLSDQTIDFGATDGPMSDAELARAKGGPILHVPTVLGADVLAYNLPGLTQPLRLTGAAIADIFLGRIVKWNDARLAAINPGVALPDQDVLVVHRSDGSGTTYIFTDYLAAVSPEWAQRVGKGKEVKWPTGLGAKGNEGVAGQVRQLPGSIGYIEMVYANQNKLAYADVQNAAGQFVRASAASTTAAAEGAMAQMGPGSDYRVSIVNAAGANAYPISSFTWLIVYQRQLDAVKGRKLVDFIRWALTEGQKSAAALDYAPLPEALASQLVERLDTIQVGTGTP